MTAFLTRNARGIVALLAIMVLFGLARLPALSDVERTTLASRFAFSAHELSLPAGVTDADTTRRLRSVHPQLDHHAGWISTVGAAVALLDLDHDGLPNDVVHVDPRFDKVIVSCAPGTPHRYDTFELYPAGLPCDDDTTAPMGVVGGDFDEDGRLDVMVYYWGRTPVIFLRNSDAPTDMTDAAYTPVEVVDTGEIWNTNAATTTDLDGDGRLDIIIGNYFRDGDRILDSQATDDVQMQDSMSRAFNGGVNRVLRGVDPGPSGSGAGSRVRFEDVTDVFDTEIARGWTLAIGAGDLDGDDRPEIYFANDFGPDRLLHNRSEPGAVRMEEVRGPKGINAPSSKALGRDSFKGMGCDFGDINGDGFFDIYVSNIADEYALQESHFAWISQPGDMLGGIEYVDRSEALGLSRSGWGWESRLADFDNDGTLEAIQATGFVKGEIDRWPELHELALGNDTLLKSPASWPRVRQGDDLSGHAHNPFFVQSESGRYYDIARDLGLGQTWVTRGIAVADIDGDGDLDFAIANQWEASWLYRNDREDAAGEQNAFIGLNLLLPPRGQGQGQRQRQGEITISDGQSSGTRGRPAIGTKVIVRHPDGRRLLGQVDGGNGHSGVRSHQVHIGLGVVDADATVPVELRWRDEHGQIGVTTVELSPGWHTIVLPDAERPDATGDVS